MQLDSCFTLPRTGRRVGPWVSIGCTSLRGGKTYSIVYSPRSERHLRALTARQRSTVLDAVEEQLSSEPTRETTNRKRLRDNPVAGWELRLGKLRVYYNVNTEPEPIVSILAIGIKQRDRVYIGGEAVNI